MTNEEKDRLIAYLVDAGEIDPEGDVEAQFLEWRQVHEQVVSGEVHYKAILEAARIRKRSFDRGYQAGCAAMLGPMTAVRPARTDDSLDHPIIRVRSTECPTCRRRWAATALGR